MLLLAAAFALAPDGPPAGWSDLATLGLRLDIRYATAANFTGAPLPGYERAGAWLRTPVAEHLLAVDTALATKGLAVLVYDAYRPERASKAMVAWAERTKNQWVIDQGYVAPRSQHNKGTTVDLTLVDRASGAPVDMGGAWDEFSSVSHTESATGAALANRHTLRDAMRAEGFAPYSKEWWHFSWPLADATALDLAY